MPMDGARVKSLFLAASDFAEPAERAAYLDRECGGDVELRARVEALLRVHDAAPPPPDPAAPTSGDLPDGKEETEDDGDPTARVGALLASKYKLVEEIGEGGMGSVFMAQQTEPVKRAVAVKVIKAGMDSKAVLARFEAERQALAMMDHPNIAKVLDAGTTEGGRPFVVMELVKGTPITRYCDEHKLTPRQRLELFVPVCQAIQHAHQKGIIHRDIKPSNVLVAMYDDRAVPKVIDFGVAKAAGQALTDKTLMTGFGAMVGTPEYMSPEQASLNNLDIDTRSDVYSLGVLLYELLTGTTPVDRKSLGKAAVLEILRIVREVEAPRPSAKLSTLDKLPSVAANRGTEPVKLSRLMKGELDWLVMKALEKDRARRYETANALGRDIQRYLADEMVEARPPSAGYRLKKFISRHKGQVLATAAVVVALVVGVAAVVAVQVRANRDLAAKNADLAAEQAKVQARFDLAVKAIETFHTGVSEDFLLKEERFKSVRDRLLKAANDFYAQLAALLSKDSDPASRRALGQANFAVAELTDKVGQKDAALAAHQQVLKYREVLAAEPGAGPELKIDEGRSLMTVARLLCLTGQTDSGLAAYRRAEAVLAEGAPSDPAVVQDALAECRVRHGYSLSNAGRNDDAVAVLRRARAELEARAAVQGLSTAARDELASAVRLIAVKLITIGHYAEAEVELRTALAMQQKLADDSRAIAPRLSDLAQSHGSLAGLLENLGRPHEALAEYRVALLVQQKLTEVQPAVTRFRLIQAWFHRGIGKLLGDLGHPSEGFAELRRALAIEQKLADEQPAYTQCRASLASTHHFIGVRFAREGQPAPALESYRAEFAILEELMKQQPDNPGHKEWFANAANDAAGALIALGRTREARALCERGLATNEALLRADAKTQFHSTSLAESLMRMGQVRRAERDFKGAALDWHRAAAMYAAGAAASEASVFAACCHAGLAGLGGVAGSGVSVVQSAAETKAAIAKLRQAAKLGMRDLSWLRTDPMFDPLRGNRDFEALLMDLANTQTKIGRARDR
jgi:serine/threonine protein kinase/tetratricopeptide (TPR) repeat protein